MSKPVTPPQQMWKNAGFSRRAKVQFMEFARECTKEKHYSKEIYTYDK